MKKISTRLEEMSGQRFGLILLSPTFIILVVLVAFPILYSIYLSFFDMILSRPGKLDFVGLKNYVDILQNPVFLNSLWKTGYFTISFLVGTTFLGIGIALILNQEFIGKSIIITILLIPWAIPRVVNALIWKWIYDGNYGVFNAIMVKLGVIDKYRFWFGESPFVSLLLISIAYMWKMIPFVALLVLAALQTIPRELYEAAKVDGANAWKRFWQITIPQLKYPLIIILILQTTRAIKVFDLIAVLTKGGPGDRTMVTYYYVYKIAFDYLNVSSGSAAAYVVTAIISLFAIFYYSVLKGGEE